MIKNIFEGLEMATKDKKTQVRLDPHIAKALAVIAKSDDMAGYELLELICVDWIKKNKPELMFMIDSVLGKVGQHPNHHIQPEPKARP